MPPQLTATPQFGTYSDTHAPTEWNTGAMVHCIPNEPFTEYDIPTPADGSVAFAADPGALVFSGIGFDDLSFAPYYTLTARLSPPGTFTSWFDPPVCRSDAPFEWDNTGPIVHGSVAGEYVDDTGAPISMDITIDGGGADAWLLEGHLVNPAPVWPSTGGNTFGSILFTAAQIAAISAQIDITSGPSSTLVNDGLLTVHLQPYTGWPAPPDLEQQGHIIGWA